MKDINVSCEKMTRNGGKMAKIIVESGFFAHKTVCRFGPKIVAQEKVPKLQHPSNGILKNHELEMT